MRTSKAIASLGILIFLIAAGSAIGQPLSDIEKRQKGENDYGDYLDHFGAVLKGGGFGVEVKKGVWFRQQHVYNSQPYTIYTDSRDPDIELKMSAVHAAFRTVADLGLALGQERFEFYLLNKNRVRSGGQPVQNITIKRGPDFVPLAKIMLADLTDPDPTKVLTPDGRRTRLSFSGVGGRNRATITVIHEIAHVLHERWAGDAFWRMTAGTPQQVFGPVSDYAKGNGKEFVAEVFTGALLGMRFPPEVWVAYRGYRGPYDYLINP
jgi:hypothetical protein